MHADISPDISDTSPHDESLLRQLEALATSGMLPHGTDGLPQDANSNKFCSCNVREQFLLPAAVSQVRPPAPLQPLYTRIASGGGNGFGTGSPQKHSPTHVVQCSFPTIPQSSQRIMGKFHAYL